MQFAKYGRSGAIFRHDTGRRFIIVRGPTFKNDYEKNYKICLSNVMHYREKINQILKTFVLISKDDPLFRGHFAPLPLGS